jgi:sulfoquinovose isomerase
MTGELTESWLVQPFHRDYLREQVMHLWRFYSGQAIDPDGGFYELEADGTPSDRTERSLVASTRMAHCFSIAHAAGIPGAKQMALHALRHIDALWDRAHGGWFWAQDGETIDDRKLNYGHAFAILAGVSATDAGIAGGQGLLTRALTVHDRHFWDETAGIAVDEYTPDWSECLPYRGQNGNMHLTEAYLAVARLTGDEKYLIRAQRIAGRLIQTHARDANWRIPEHYNSSWEPELNYGLNTAFDVWKPFGATTGHGMEWSRLLLQMWQLGDRQVDWLPHAARSLLHRALLDGWNTVKGGVAFTTDWDGKVVNGDRYHWVQAEAIAASAAYLTAFGDDVYTENRYRELWEFADAHLVDHTYGGWYPQLDENNVLKTDPWFGKPDVYHVLAACLLPYTDPLNPLPTSAVRAATQLQHA